MRNRREILRLLKGAAALGALAPMASPAQDIKQVKIIFGFPAGSSGDSVARRVAEKMSGSGYTRNAAFVENRPGASGRIAVEVLKNSPPDGSVLALAPVSALAVYPYIYTNLSYKPEDVAPVSIGAIIMHGLAVGPMVPREVKTLEQFLQWSRQNPDKASFGSPGAGSMPHMLGALLGIRSKVPLHHVAYRGTMPSVTDLVGGQIAAAINPSGDYLQYVKDGKLRVLATSGRKRSPFFPDVPTFTELGYPDIVSEEWFGFYAPARTPADVIARANAVITGALRQRDVIDSFAALGLLAHGSSPEEMLADQRAELQRWKPLIKEIGFTLDS